MIKTGQVECKCCEIKTAFRYYWLEEYGYGEDVKTSRTTTRSWEDYCDEVNPYVPCGTQPIYTEVLFKIVPKCRKRKK